MNELYAKPNLLKQINLSQIRKIIKNKFTSTRAEIAQNTNMSSTTIRTLLSEMLQSGEIESIGYDVSSGGRKAERYRFKPDRYHSAAFFVCGNQIYCLLVNVCGEIAETEKIPYIEHSFESDIINFLEEKMPKKHIKSIAIGVPGIVEDNSFWKKDDSSNVLCNNKIGDTIMKKYSIPVVLENDINATAIGFNLMLNQKKLTTDCNKSNLAYINFERDCIKAGFIIGGKTLRGYNNFAGEIGLMTMDNGELLNSFIAQNTSEHEYENLVSKITKWICVILNPEHIIFGGKNFKEQYIDSIQKTLPGLACQKIHAKLMYSNDVLQDSLRGIAFIAASNMFDEVQLERE